MIGASSEKASLRASAFYLLAGLSCLVFWATGGTAQAPPTVDHGPLDHLSIQPEFAKEFVQKTFVGCANRDSVFWSLPADGGNPFYCPRTDFFDKPTTSCRAVWEYQHPQFSTKAEVLSAADRANGIEWRGYVGAHWTINRIRWIANDTWEEWGPWVDNPNTEPSDFVELVKKNGTWSVGQVGSGLLKIPLPYSVFAQAVRPSCLNIFKDAQHLELGANVPANLSSLLADDMKAGGFDPEEYSKEISFVVSAAKNCAGILNTGTAKYGSPSKIGGVYKNCDSDVDVSRSVQATHGHGDLTARIGNFASGKDWKADSTFGISVAVGGRAIWTDKRMTDEPGGSDLPVPKIARRHSSTYEGNISEFQAALQSAVEQSAQDWGYPPHSFDKETEFIYDAARLCASITPPMFAGVEQVDSLLQPYRIDRKYSICDRGYHGVTAAVRSYDRTRERGLVMTIAPQGSWRAGQGITMRIMFSGLSGDDVSSNLPDYYGVLVANLKTEPLPPGTVIEFPKPPAASAAPPGPAKP